MMRKVYAVCCAKDGTGKKKPSSSFDKSKFELNCMEERRNAMEEN